MDLPVEAKAVFGREEEEADYGDNGTGDYCFVAGPQVSLKLEDGTTGIYEATGYWSKRGEDQPYDADWVVELALFYLGEVVPGDLTDESEGRFRPFLAKGGPLAGRLFALDRKKGAASEITVREGDGPALVYRAMAYGRSMEYVGIDPFA